MDDYMSKPIDFAKLEQVLKKWLPLQEVIDSDEGKLTISLFEPVDIASPENGSNGMLKRLQKKYGAVRSKRLVEIFIESSDKLLAVLADAIAHRDSADMRRCAHELAGACMVLGADTMGSNARQLEKMDPIDWKEAEATANATTLAFRQVKTELVVKS
jgi:HPt (histidine-containing phosphotransfer) domain-containing protein